MATRMDTYIPDYALNVPVANGVAWYGAIIPLYNAMGFSVYATSTGGATGTITVSPTNAVGNTALYNVNGGALPPSAQGATANLAINNATSATFTQATNGTYFNAVYVSFAPSASGFLNICINVRRFGA